MMKHLLSMVFVILFGSTVFAQYPTDEVIKPYPKPIKERALLQRFDGNATQLSKWRALHHAKMSATDKAIVIESTGHDPYVAMPGIEKPTAGTFEFRIKMKSDTAPKGEVFWSTTKKPGAHAEASFNFDFKRGEWGVYGARFEVPDPLTGLRLDPGSSTGTAEIEWIELYKIVYDDAEPNNTPWYDADWAKKVDKWIEVGVDGVKIKIDEKCTGFRVFQNEKPVGDVYPLGYVNTALPIAGVADSDEPVSGPLVSKKMKVTKTGVEIEMATPDGKTGTLQFELKTNGEIGFQWTSKDATVFGPVFRPLGEMQQAVLSGLEYLEKGEHSSSTADLIIEEHLRFAPKPLDVTWPLMAIVTETVGFGLFSDNPETQMVFATPDFLFGDTKTHYMGLHGKRFSGTVKIIKPVTSPKFSPLDELILWGVQKNGLPDLPPKPRDDEAQRLLNLAGYEKSVLKGSDGAWRHATGPNIESVPFKPLFGSDFVTAIWQLTGKLPEVSRLDHGGAHLPNPACYFLRSEAERFLNIYKSQAQGIMKGQRPDGSFGYAGKYLRGHWEDTASGHCGNSLYRLMYAYRVVNDAEILPAVKRGLDFANKYTVPRGAQVWELSLHTPDIMGSSRMCMANIWYYEATGEKPYLDAAVRWAVTGLPFVYLWEQKSNSARAEGMKDFVMKYATTPVFGATNWKAPNWIGLPVQWCGLDYGEACFLLAEHDKTLDWKKIAEGILLAGEQMQYPEGDPCVGLLPDSFVLASQIRRPWDINPTVLVMQRRRLQGKLESVDIVKQDGLHVVSPFKTKIENGEIIIEGDAGTTYQILVNGKAVTRNGK